MAARGRELELALRIRTDLDQAVGDLKKMEVGLDGVKKSGKTAGAGLNDLRTQATATRQRLQALTTAEVAAADATRVHSAEIKALRSGVTGLSRSLGGNVNSNALRLATSFGLVGAAVGGVVTGIALFVRTAYEGYNQTQAFKRELIATGGAAGFTASGFESAAASIDDSTGAIGRGREALLALLSSGRGTAATLEQLARGAVALSEVTGQSIEETTRQIQGMLKDPAKAVAELNEQYHFLTAAEYAHVVALEAVGKETEAAQFAGERFADAMTQRLDEVHRQQGFVERAWRAIKEAAAEGVDAVRSVGRAQTLKEEVDSLRDFIALVDGNPTAVALLAGNPVTGTWLTGKLGGATTITQLRERLARKEIELIEETQRAEAQAEKARNEAAAIDAQRRQQKLLDQDKEIAKAKELKQLEEDFAKIRATGRTTFDGMPINSAEAKRRAQIEERYRDRTPQQKAPKTAIDRDALDRERFVKQLERQAAVLGLTREQTLQYEIAERKLTGALKERAEASAKAIGEDERKKQATADAKQVAEIQTQYLRAIGQNAQAAEHELERRYEALLTRLVARGDKGGEQIVRKLFSAEKTRVQLDQIQQAFGRFLQDISREEQRINIARENGLISSVEAQRRLLALRQQEIAKLQQIIPLLEAQNAALEEPNSELTQRIADLKLQLFDLQSQASLAVNAFRQGFEGGLGDALNKLATGTATLRDAVVGLLQDMTRAMANFAAQQLASIATAQLMKLVSGGAGGGNTPNLAAPDPAQAAQAGVAYAAPIMTAAGALAASAIPLQAAASQLQAAAYQMAAASAASAYAEGGYTGPGGKYQPAGIVHAGEYVQPQRVVREPGALHFMENFRRMGMRAIDNWRGYAGGGLVVDSPSVSSQMQSLGAPGASGGSERSSSAVLLGLEDGLVVKHIKSPRGVEAMVQNITRNPALFRGALGV